MLDVPGFEGILIHRGNTAGCILVGENKTRGQVIHSTVYEIRLTERMERAQSRGEIITFEIVES
ncbi:MAG: DUF5675 family protein [Odoribacter splanchnicus]